MPKLGMLKTTQLKNGTQDNRSVSFTIKDIPIGDIHIKMNIRRDYSNISELAESIRQYGLLQPITIFAVKDGYTVKTGHRRFMAYKMLYQDDPDKFHNIRCIISDNHNTTLIQLVENLQRVDLSQFDLFQSLNQLREQGMTLKQIGEVIGKTEGYIKSLFVGVNVINKDKELQNLISDASITIRDIAETNTVVDKEQRFQLLDERKNRKINRAQMRDKVRELSSSKPKNTIVNQKKVNDKSIKTFLTIKVFPDMSKIIIYLTNKGTVEQLKSLEEDLKYYFSNNSEKYSIGKSSPNKEEL